jgi:hypothetical protein
MKSIVQRFSQKNKNMKGPPLLCKHSNSVDFEFTVYMVMSHLTHTHDRVNMDYSTFGNGCIMLIVLVHFLCYSL